MSALAAALFLVFCGCMFSAGWYRGTRRKEYAKMALWAAAGLVFGAAVGLW